MLEAMRPNFTASFTKATASASRHFTGWKTWVTRPSSDVFVTCTSGKRSICSTRSKSRSRSPHSASRCSARRLSHNAC